jgi:DNA-binding LytR/AlgR family response regulator
MEISSLTELQELLNPVWFSSAKRQYILHIRAIDRIRSTCKGLSVHLEVPQNQEVGTSRKKGAAFIERITE